MVVLSSGREDFFYHESYCDESVIMTIYEFFVTSVPGGGDVSLYGIWAGSTHIWVPPHVFRGTKMSPSLLLKDA